MTDGELIYQTILDEPDSDEPRLVYADWLEENGQSERAEFIRVQCELADKSCLQCRGNGVYVGASNYYEPCFACCTRSFLDRELELWEMSASDGGWLIKDYILHSEIIHHQCLPRNNMASATHPDFTPIIVYRSGFPDEVRCNMRGLLDHAKELSRFPLRKVVVTDRKPIRVDSEAIEGWKQYRFMCFPSVPWRDHTPEYLPYEFRRYMIGRLGGDAIYYDNLEESNALDDLSRASLLYIRSLRQPIGVLTHANAL